MEAEIERLEDRRDELLALHKINPLDDEQCSELFGVVVRLEEIDWVLAGGKTYNYSNRPSQESATNLIADCRTLELDSQTIATLLGRKASDGHQWGG